MRSNKIHLVCSSGGVKCFSYLGAVSQLYKSGIEIASISACSMGTIVGALIASGKNLEEIEAKLLSFDFSTLKTKKFLGIFRLFFSPFATYRTPDYEKVMVQLFGQDLTLKEFKIPFSALALDIRQKRFLVYSSATHPDMKISEVVKIATSIPLMYAPYEFEKKRSLVDAALATESPVWMAVNQKGNYPIVVLKVSKDLSSDYKSNVGAYVGHLISVAAESHDYFAASQISRSIDININCESMPYANFNISKEQIENLILQGEAAAEQQLKEFNNDFNHILSFETKSSIEEIVGPVAEDNQPDTDANNAVNLANNMITGFKNEIMNRSQIFVSYSHKDRKWLEKLNTSLSVIERYTGIKAWSDKLIFTADTWNNEISKALSSAKVAVFLVTADFLASKFIQDNELGYFLEINKIEKVPIIWIAVSSSNYKITPLNDIQCANNPDTPLDTLTEGQLNIEITKICDNILKLMA